MGSGSGWLAGDWLSKGRVLNITAAAWTAGFDGGWRSSNITRTQNVSEYMLVLALCLVLTYGHVCLLRFFGPMKLNVDQLHSHDPVEVTSGNIN